MKIRELISNRRKYYKRLTPTYSQTLEKTVYFTSVGFNHLLYKNRTRPRKIPEQYMKLQCLKYAKTVIKKSRNISSVRKIKRKVKGKLKTTTYYELVHEVLKNAKIRVIVERVGNGKYKFRSIMPHNNHSKKILSKTKKRR